MAEEIYEGVKFKTVFLSNEIPSDVRLKELKNWCKLFHEHKLAPPYEGGSAGNLSFRLNPDEQDFIITGTQIGLKNELSDDMFVIVRKCDFENRRIFVEGKKTPSSESFLHAAIYNNRSDVQAIFHGHSEEILKNIHKLNLIETRHEESYGTLNLVHAVLNVLDEHNFLIIKNHGFVSLGVDLENTGQNVMSYLNNIG